MKRRHWITWGRGTPSPAISRVDAMPRRRTESRLVRMYVKTAETEPELELWKGIFESSKDGGTLCCGGFIHARGRGGPLSRKKVSMEAQHAEQER